MALSREGEAPDEPWFLLVIFESNVAREDARPPENGFGQHAPKM